jgi:hypothetical protein
MSLGKYCVGVHVLTQLGEPIPRPPGCLKQGVWPAFREPDRKYRIFRAHSESAPDLAGSRAAMVDEVRKVGLHPIGARSHDTNRQVWCSCPNCPNPKGRIQCCAHF